MAKVDIEKIKKLRNQTAAPVMECRRALEEAGGDLKKAADLLREWGLEKAEKKKGRQAAEGIIYAYIHHGNRVGAMVELNCETDFVAKTNELKKLAHEIAMQVASMDPKDIDTLLGQEYIRDSKMTIKDLINSVISKVGENIVLRRFVRYEVGQ